MSWLDESLDATDPAILAECIGKDWREREKDESLSYITFNCHDAIL